MTTVEIRPVRVAGVLRLSAGRLLRLELRHNAMMWMVPLVAVMFWFDAYRSSMMFPPTFGTRTLYLQMGKELPDFVPFVAGAAAWMGSRDGRRGIADQVAVTTLPRWAGRLAVWAATTGWALVAFLGCTGVFYALTALRNVPGTPPWWPIIVGAVVVTALSTLGFAAGVWFPGRYTAPMAAVVALLLFLVIYRIRTSSPYMLISPLTSPLSHGTPDPQGGAFYRYLPDLPIVQVMFIGGLAVAVLGALGVQAVCGGRRLRGAAATVAVIGLAVAGTGIGLVGTARVHATGVAIPALHDAADDRPIAYTPVCGHAAVPVCLNPVYRTFVPTVTGALTPILNEVAGLPGAPVRVTQVRFTGDGPQVSDLAITGNPPVLSLGLNVGLEGMACFGSPNAGPPGTGSSGTGSSGTGSSKTVSSGANSSGADSPGTGSPPTCATADQLWTTPSLANRMLRPQAAMTVLGRVIGSDGPAQQAVSTGLLMAAGVHLIASPDGPPSPSGAPSLAPGTPAYAAAQKFAALPAATRHAWLTRNLAALRAEHLTLKDLP